MKRARSHDQKLRGTVVTTGRVRVYTINMATDEPSPTELRLLCLLDRELSGRDVAGAYLKTYGKRIAYGTLYTLLRRLGTSGWVNARDDADADGRVRFFVITAAGVRARFYALSTHNDEGRALRRGLGEPS